MTEFLPPTHLWLPGVIALIGLILASGFFSASETALFYLSHDELRSLRTGTPRERVAAELLRHPDRLLTAILFWNLLINLAFFATSIVIARQLDAEGYRSAAGTLSVGSLFVVILFGEVLPKSGAVAFHRKLAAWVSYPLATAVRLLDPIIPGLARTTRVLRRAFWPHIRRETHLDADDLERAVEFSELGEEMVRQERQILHNILDLSEITVEEVMRPRGTYLSLPSPVKISDLGGRVPECGYLIVQQTGEEEIEGAIPLMEFADLTDTHLEQAAEDVVHVPWCANLAYTLQRLRDQFCGLACVVNEYGETIGIVTYEDIIETVLLPAASRAKRVLRKEPVEEISPGCYRVEGITTLRYLCRRLNEVYQPDPNEVGVVTVAGLLYEKLEHIPVVGDECTWRDYHLKVIESESPGHLRVLLTRRNIPEGTQ
ncbi:MAG: CNNM domain-containing protein [Planctomycetaceae bacterium]